MTKAPAKRKLDLFSLLESLDLRRMEIFDEIAADPEMLKELKKEVGYMVPVWMTGAARDADHIELVQRFNAVCNIGWYGLYGQHRMQTRLLAHIGLGRKVAHRFNRIKGGSRNSAMYDLLSLTHPDIRPAEILIWVRRNSWEDAEELARGHGWTDEQIDRLEKNFKEMRT